MIYKQVKIHKPIPILMYIGHFFSSFLFLFWFISKVVKPLKDKSCDGDRDANIEETMPWSKMLNILMLMLKNSELTKNETMSIVDSEFFQLPNYCRMFCKIVRILSSKWFLMLF